MYNEHLWVLDYIFGTILLEVIFILKSGLHKACQVKVFQCCKILANENAHSNLIKLINIYEFWLRTWKLWLISNMTWQVSGFELHYLWFVLNTPLVLSFKTMSGWYIKFLRKWYVYIRLYNGIWNKNLQSRNTMICHFNISILYHLVCIHMRVCTNIKFK